MFPIWEASGTWAAERGYSALSWQKRFPSCQRRGLLARRLGVPSRVQACPLNKALEQDIAQTHSPTDASGFRNNFSASHPTVILVPGNKGLQMASWLLHPSGAHMESCLFRELKESLPHVSCASSPLLLCLRPSFCIPPPPSISPTPQVGVGPLIGTLAQGILLSFRFVLFFFLLILFPSPVPRSGLSEGQSRGKVPPSAITSALPQVSMLPPALPAGPATGSCVPRCVIQQSLQGPYPVYCSHPLLCAWPRTQVNHLARGPPRELCLQVHH